MFTFNRTTIINYLLLTVLILILAQSCNNTRRISSDRQTPEIYFGRTGGFTNIPVEYRLNEKGDVFKISGDESTKINDVSRKKMKMINKILNDLDFEHIQINEPGNISYFIRVNKSGYEKSVIWNDLTSHDSLKNLYKELLTTVNP